MTGLRRDFGYGAGSRKVYGDGARPAACSRDDAHRRTRCRGCDRRDRSRLGFAVEIALEPFVGQPIVLDLRRVEFMDSAGLKVLLHQRSRIQESGGDLRLVVGNGAVGRLLELTGVSEAFSISDSIE